MNEFQWLRQMRQLKQDVDPADALWSRIEQAIEQPTATQSAPARTGHRRDWAIAASFAAILVLAGGLAWQLQRQADMTPVSTVASVTTHGVGATAPWKPSDPRLAGAAIELDAARMELQQAIQQSPDSPALQRLLQQTDAQQSALREMEKRAG